MFVLWFRASMCFRFWSKTYTKCCTNNSLLSCVKIISSLLELIDHMLSISEYVWKNIRYFWFWWKSCTNNFVISRVERFSLPALCSWSSAFNLRICFWKRKNAVLILLHFCLLYWLSPVFIVAANCFNYIGFCRCF